MVRLIVVIKRRIVERLLVIEQRWFKLMVIVHRLMVIEQLGFKFIFEKQLRRLGVNKLIGSLIDRRQAVVELLEYYIELWVERFMKRLW